MVSSRDKLTQAALELIATQGYQQTTVQQIAARAGVTERTFFRQFSDKSDMLFSKSDEYVALYRDGLAQSTSTTPLMLVYDTYLYVAATLFANLFEQATRRNKIITTEPDLIERELYKNFEVTQFLTDRLAETFPILEANLAVQSINGVFHTAFTGWVNSDGEWSLAAIFTETFEAWQKLR